MQNTTTQSGKQGILWLGFTYLSVFWCFPFFCIFTWICISLHASLLLSIPLQVPSEHVYCLHCQNPLICLNCYYMKYFNWLLHFSKYSIMWYGWRIRLRQKKPPKTHSKSGEPIANNSFKVVTILYTIIQ